MFKGVEYLRQSIDLILFLFPGFCSTKTASCAGYSTELKFSNNVLQPTFLNGNETRFVIPTHDSWFPMEFSSRDQIWRMFEWVGGKHFQGDCWSGDLRGRAKKVTYYTDASVRQVGCYDRRQDEKKFADRTCSTCIWCKWTKAFHVGLFVFGL